MRTRANINLDGDSYCFASACASAKGIPLGAAVSELVRQRADQVPEPSITASLRLRTNAHGLLVKAKTGKVITPEMVKETSEDDLA